MVVTAELVIEDLENIRHGDIFGEGFRVTIAEIGEVCTGEIPD